MVNRMHCEVWDEIIYPFWNVERILVISSQHFTVLGLKLIHDSESDRCLD